MSLKFVIFLYFLGLSGGLQYEIQVKILAEAFHLYGEELESKIIERFAEYKVNGIKGNGITEWQSRNMTS